MFIYFIRNKINGKRYIGITTLSIEKRCREHYERVNSKQHWNRTFYKALRKYGTSNFYLEWSCDYTGQVESYDELCEIEQYMIKKYNTYIGFKNCQGYNMTLGGEDAAFNNKKPVKQYNLDCTVLINTFVSINEASRQTNSNHIEIMKCCNDRARSANGFVWAYIGNEPIQYHNPILKPVCQYDVKTLKLIKEYPSIAAAVREVGGSPVSIGRVCNNDVLLQTNGFIWAYKGNKPKPIRQLKRTRKRVLQLHKKTKQVIAQFESIMEAGKLTKSNYKAIGDCCNGRLKSTNGFCWEFA